MAPNDQELRAAANVLLQQHGDQAPPRMAEWTGEPGLAGHSIGAEVWIATARRKDQLMLTGELN